MNTTENNKIIAEFMDKDVALLESVGIEKYTSDELQYHKSWNWLMPVVKKIDNLFGEDDTIDDIINRVHNAILQFDRKKVYNAVVEFIKWHNLNK